MWMWEDDRLLLTAVTGTGEPASRFKTSQSTSEIYNMSSLLAKALENASLDAQHRPSGSHEEDDLISVKSAQTPIPSRPQSLASSRSTSPTRHGSRLSRRHVNDSNDSEFDPLKRFTSTINVIIFGALGVQDLARCQRVSKRWKRSQTINYAWYCLFQRRAFVDSGLPKPVWTRRESKQDWAAKFKQMYRRDDLDHATVDAFLEERARSDGYRTPKEEREDRWKEENESNSMLTKVEARAYYKSLKNSKVKGKGSAFGGVSRDRGGFQDAAAYD